MALLILLLSLLAVPTARAQSNNPDQPIAGVPVAADAADFTRQVETWSRRLEVLDGAVRDPGAGEAELIAWRHELETIRDNAREAAAATNESLAKTRTLLDALGPPPTEEGAKEAPELAQQRANLNAELADLDGRAKRAAIVAARAVALIDIAVEATRKLLTDRVLSREPSPLSLELLAKAGPEGMDVVEQLADAPANWWTIVAGSVDLGGALPTLLLVIAGATVMGWPIRRWLLRRGGPRAEVEAPNQARRVLAAAAGGLASCVIPVLAIGSVYVSLKVHGLLVGDMRFIVTGLIVGLSLYFVIAGFAHVALQPHLPQWRVAGLEEESADSLDARLRLLAVMVGISVFLRIALRITDQGESLDALLDFLANSTLAFGLWPMLSDRAWRRSAATMDAADGETQDPRLYILPRRILRLAVLAIPISALAGYHNLSDYLTRNVVMVGLLFGLFWAISTLVGEAVWALINAQRGPLRQIRGALGLSEDSGRIAHFWIAGFFNIVLAGVIFLLFLPSAGVPRQDILDFLESGVTGVTIGNFTLSFTDILLSITIFVLALRVTRMVQRLLERRILPQTRFDVGARNSIKSAAGYAGTTLGLVVAVSVAGIDFSNIAIIAGALSVGIGFGLQNVVNNFISGLIVLAERPIKVGDWIIVGTAEGTVRRINVRATEIETFTRATVVVPNGELLSQSIVNYTLRNKMGRIEIPVGVAYGSDTALVEKTLMEVATGHKSVLSYPKPYVVFQAFGASSLDFILRCYIANVEEILSVRTALMFAIDRGFRERDIEIPFNQTDVNFKDRDFERLAALVDRLVEARLAAGANKAADTDTAEGKTEA
ncbi:mechanosensitive ion channel [Zavarzinia compransoris]|uniref:mechanosensitive ion channel family protein n=1 Tax=Zavarzinia marina TaxID=2911065 RepID=UPI001F347562|nr:mechanosensitive ion channel domain-containing protein [Zavarzinia marina]MCF4167221.1 mechanosensitive ion channel [Zavarzinia marina]